MSPLRLPLLRLCLLLVFIAPAGAAPAAIGPGTSSEPPAKSLPAEALQAIVKLCAVDPGSQELTEAWQRYVAENFEPGRDFSKTIDLIIERATAQRQARHAAAGALSWNATERRKIRSHLQRTALVTIDGLLQAQTKPGSSARATLPAGGRASQAASVERRARRRHAFP